MNGSHSVDDRKNKQKLENGGFLAFNKSSYIKGMQHGIEICLEIAKDDSKQEIEQYYKSTFKK